MFDAAGARSRQRRRSICNSEGQTRRNKCQPRASSATPQQTAAICRATGGARHPAAARERVSAPATAMIARSKTPTARAATTATSAHARTTMAAEDGAELGGRHDASSPAASNTRPPRTRKARPAVAQRTAARQAPQGPRSAIQASNARADGNEPFNRPSRSGGRCGYSRKHIGTAHRRGVTKAAPASSTQIHPTTRTGHPCTVANALSSPDRRAASAWPSPLNSPPGA